MSRLAFYWIRHAPPINPDGLCYGQADIPVDLSDKDRLRRIAGVLPARALWISSPSPRARGTLRALADAKGLPDMAIWQQPRLIEQSFGVWQTMKRSDLTLDPVFKAYIAAPDRVRPPQGENLTDLFQRVSPAIDSFVRMPSGDIPGRPFVIGAHGGTIRAALSHATGRTMTSLLKEKIDPLSLTIVSCDSSGSDWRVEALNARP